MKFLIISFALAVVASAQYQNVYKEPGTYKTAAIIRQASELNPDGAYSYNYETENGISAAESGALKALGPKGEPAIDVEGGFQYTAPDGQVIAVKYTAGPQGFLPAGAHLPVPHPIPELIARSLAFNAAHPYKEDVEGYYKPEVQKTYYTTPQPIYEPTYTTPRPYYKPVTPTYQPTFQPINYTPRPYYAARR